ncbi:HAMP domain-containing histidine kinase [Candidatus Gracilibacteria bacterium]|nr:HAMP domain-containing histidine kinase [Candidatus Gracilibacteria bacterium]OIO77257.1 MAG: hypothetical protein AUJ87_01575 [Candidatus Gracilibacteria bacterium CG1_02_38_174]PIQ11743.1 MAG: hypothetical protein COW68_01985 [Candidatus Gracilibacteria bacterium CG18_big_fil_WC_8_21_14_2_50_38_16]PIQ41817.1 MAG: hypothetical protein COW06_01730 [Candidatus Gracilibacteria bacterium CG12_big_fil_rev_8_21_14_0_65_38_15]PIZ01856.1 MAG: hypothetical protein COY60_01310 [Candidatus Gracilibact
MLFPRLKTSTNTALIFAFFTSVLLITFVAILNIYYFYTWQVDEEIEMIEKTEQLTKNIFEQTNGSGVSSIEKQNLFYKRIVEQGGMIKINGSGTLVSPKWNEEKPNFLGVYKSGAEWYMRYTFPLQNIGTIGLPYKITEHIYGQVSLLWVSLLLTVFFLIIIAVISVFFAHYSLRPLSKIIHYIHSFKIGSPLPKFPLSGPDDDEFIIVTKTLSDAFKKIQSQTEVLRQFSIDAAHEFKTPLMVIHSEIDCAIKSGDYRTGMDNIQSQIYFLDTMINTLLTIARLEKDELKKAEVNISELLEETISKTELLFEKKGLNVVRIIEKNVLLNSNYSMLQIIVSNLLSNAFNYTNTGEIRVTLNKNGFSVQDTGIGISEENIEKIWDRLYRVDSSWSVQNSHGLGLFLVKTVVEKLGYTIRVESKQGEGSTFSVQF